MIKFGIIAAGDGTRIKAEGAEVSKPLLDIDGQPMIARLINLMAECGSAMSSDCSLVSPDESIRIGVIINREMPDVERYIQNFVPDVKCNLQIITAKTPSSMHSFYQLLKEMEPNDKFIVTTVDTIFSKEVFFKYVESFINCPRQVDGLMGVTSYIDDEKPLYVATAGNHKITSFPENFQEEIRYVSAGVYGLRKNSLTVLQYCIDNGIDRMRNFQRRLIFEGFDLHWFDMGKVFDIDHLSDLEKAKIFLAKSGNRNK